MPNAAAIGANIAPINDLSGAGRNAPNALPICPIAATNPNPTALNGSIITSRRPSAIFAISITGVSNSDGAPISPPPAACGNVRDGITTLPPAALPSFLSFF